MAGRSARGGPELLRPPAHRGPLIAAGAVVLAVGIAVFELRLDEPVGDGVHLLVAGLAAALIGWLGWQAELEDSRPFPFGSVLLVTALGLLAVVLWRLADVLGAGDADYPAGALVWTSLLLCGAAAVASAARNSAACGLIAALALTSAVLNALQWLLDPDSATGFRVLLVLLAFGFVLGSLTLRGRRDRHSVILVDVAGLLFVALGLTFVSFGLLGVGDDTAGVGTGWELLLLGAGFGLVAYGAVDREPGPALLGVTTLALFVLLVVETDDGEATLLWWPGLLLALGIGVLAAGLRPRDPLPPEPEPYPASDLPLASRTDGDDDDTVVRVRVDD